MSWGRCPNFWIDPLKITFLFLGSICYLIIPVGCCFSGFGSGNKSFTLENLPKNKISVNLFRKTDLLGRKRMVMLTNVPFAIGWFMLYQSTEIWHIFIGEMLLLLSEGLVKTTMTTYAGEVWWDFFYQNLSFLNWFSDFFNLANRRFGEFWLVSHAIFH